MQGIVRSSAGGIPQHPALRLTTPMLPCCHDVALNLKIRFVLIAIGAPACCSTCSACVWPCLSSGCGQHFTVAVLVPASCGLSASDSLCVEGSGVSLRLQGKHLDCWSPPACEVLYVLQDSAFDR